VTPEALSAGKYAAYIWPAYAVSVLGFAWMIVDTLVRARRWKGRADRLDGDDERQRDPAALRGTGARPESSPDFSVEGRT
jgi:heme exporter protein D